MTVFRIAQKKHIQDLSGYGAYVAGGRWNLSGTYALYTACHRSLAYVEYLVHQFERDTWPIGLQIATLEVVRPPDQIAILDEKDLPMEWQQLAYYSIIQSLCPSYFDKGYLGVQVPSVIVPNESNIILNPKHPSFDVHVTIRQIEPLSLDQRFGPLV